MVVRNQRREWWRAIKGMYRLALHTEDTTQVFEVIHALSGNNMQQTYERAKRLPEGRRLIREKPFSRRISLLQEPK